jgi:hypothetical protein
VSARAAERYGEREVGMKIEELSNLLWKERQLLELLAFKLATEQLLLGAGEGRFLHLAAREVEQVLGAVHETEILRAAVADGVGAELGLGSNPSLRALCDRAPAPWGTILEDHRVAFLALTDTIQSAANTNRELLLRAQQATKDALAWFDDVSAGDDTYEPIARPVERVARIFDEVL